MFPFPPHSDEDLAFFPEGSGEFQYYFDLSLPWDMDKGAH